MAQQSCEISALAAAGKALGFDSFDKADRIVAKAFLMADTIKDLTDGAVDYTNICALADSMNQYHGLSKYQTQSARVYAWGQIHKITVGEEPNWDDVRAAITCAKCNNIGQEDLENAFTFLLCTLVNLIEGP